jgi:hypothetical protein
MRVRMRIRLCLAVVGLTVCTCVYMRVFLCSYVSLVSGSSWCGSAGCRAGPWGDAAVRVPSRRCCPLHCREEPGDEGAPARRGCTSVARLPPCAAFGVQEGQREGWRFRSRFYAQVAQSRCNDKHSFIPHGRCVVSLGSTLITVPVGLLAALDCAHVCTPTPSHAASNPTRPQPPPPPMTYTHTLHTLLVSLQRRCLPARDRRTSFATCASPSPSWSTRCAAARPHRRRSQSAAAALCTVTRTCSGCLTGGAIDRYEYQHHSIQPIDRCDQWFASCMPSRESKL